MLTCQDEYLHTNSSIRASGIVGKWLDGFRTNPFRQQQLASNRDERRIMLRGIAPAGNIQRKFASVDPARIGSRINHSIRL